ncbi:unnamed protein product [Closterium sp. NIES-54]
MTSLRRSGGSGDDGGGSTGSGGGRPSNRYGAVRWGVSGGGQMRVHQRQHEALTPKQLREWYTSRDGGGGSSGGRSAAIQLGVTGRGLPKLQWRPRETLSPQQLLRQGVDIFTLDYDAILTAMYDLSASAEGDCSRCVTPDPSIAAAALGASESGTLPGTAPAQALHTFTLDSGASCCFFCDSTTLTPLLAPVPVRLADPSGGPVVAHSSTVLLCSAVLSGSLSGLHLPSFSTNLVSTAALKDAIVTTTTPGGRRVSICTCTRTGRDLATFTRRPGSSLYTLTTEPSLVATSAQVTASGRVAASCSCRLLLHQTLLWHHHLGHPSLPCLRGMHYHLLVSGLPRFLPPLLPSPAPPCLPCVEGRQRAAPHPSSFPPTTAPLQTLHMDVLGPACVSGQGRERGGEISNLLQEFWCGEGILHSFTLPDSPQKNGIAERRIGLVMEVDRTSMIQAGAPHFLWPFAVWYAAHQLNLWPCVSLLETSPTLRWRREVGDASVFRVWSSRAFVRDTFADKLSTCAIPCVFLGFVPDARGWQFYNPTSCPALPSQDVTFDESVPFNRLFPYRTAPPPPPPLFLAPGPPPVDPLMPLGPAPSGVSQVDSLAGTAPVEVAVGSGAAPGAASGGAASGGAASGGATSGCAEPGGAEPGGEEPGGVEPEGVEPGGAESEGAESGGAEPRGAASSGGPAGASPLLSPQQLREWLVWRTRLKSGAPGAGGAGDAGAGGAGVTTGAGGTGGTAAASPGGARTRGSCAGGAGAGGAGARGAGVGVTGAGGAGAAGAGAVDSGARGAIVLRSPASAVPLSLVSLHCSPTVPSLESIAASALVAELLDFAAACRLDYATALVVDSTSASPPSVGGECALGTDVLEDRQEDFECLASAVPRFASMLLAPEGDPDALDIPTTRTYVEAIMGPYSSQWQAAMDAEMASWKSTGTYVNEVPPPGANIVDGMWIFRVKRPPGSPPAFNARYVARGFSQRQGVDYFHTFFPTPKMTTLRVLLHVAAQRDYEIHSLDFSTAFLQGSLHEEIWLRRPLGFTEYFPAGLHLWLLRLLLVLLTRRCFYTPTPCCCRSTSLCTLFATADTEAVILVKSELQKRHTCPDLGELCSYLGLQITRDIARRTITLTQSHMVHQVLQRFGFQFSLPQLTPLSTGHSLLAPPSDESVEPNGLYPELVGCLMYLMTYTRPDLAYPLSLLAHYVAPGRDRKTQAMRKHQRTRKHRRAQRIEKTAAAALKANPRIDDNPKAKDLEKERLIALFESIAKSDAPIEIFVDLVRHLVQRGTPSWPNKRIWCLLHDVSKNSLVQIGAAYRRNSDIPTCAPERVANVSVAKDVGAASASVKRRSGKGKGGKGGGGGSGSSGGGSCGGGGGVGTAGGSGGSSGGGGGSSGSGGGGGSGTGTRRGGSGGGQRQQQQRQSETPSPQQLREWFLRGASGGSCPYVIRTGDRAGQTCGRSHTQHRFFSRLDDAWRAEFGDDVELPRWEDLLKSRIAIFDLDLDAIQSAMYALSFSAEGDCYRCVPPDPGIAAAALGASVSGNLLGLQIPSFSTNLVSTAALQDAMVTTTTLGVQRVSICTCTRTGCHLATFTRLSGSSLYTLATEPSQVAASAQVSVPGQVSASCSCRLQSHQTLLWHHRLGHPFLPRLRGMHSRLLFSGLPTSLPPLTPSPAPPCLPCVEGRQRTAPHSSLFPPTIAPLQAFHMDVWGPARVSGQSRERYFLLVVDDYTRYTTVFPLRSKGQVVDVLIPWIRTVRLQLREWFCQDLPILCLHSDRGAQPLTPCLLAGDLAHTALDGGGWRCVGVPGLGISCLCSRYVRGQALPRAIPCDVTFDESVPFYRLFPYGSAPPPPPPLFLTPGPLPVAVGSGAPRGAAPGGAASEGADPESAESEGAETAGAEPGGGEPGGSACASSRLSPQQLCEWFFWRTRLRSGASGAGGAGAAGAGGTGVAAGAGVTGGTTTTGPGGARTRGTGAAGTRGVEGAGAGDLTENGATCAGVAKAGGARVGGPSAGGAGVGGPSVGGAGAGAPGAVDPGGALRPRPYFVPLLQQVLGTPPSADLTPRLLCPPPDQSQPQLQPASPLSAPSPYTEQSGSLTEQRECESTTAYASYACLPLLYYAISSIG